MVIAVTYAQAKKGALTVNVLLAMLERLLVRFFLGMATAMISQILLSVITMVVTVVIMNGRSRETIVLNVSAILMRVALLKEVIL